MFGTPIKIWTRVAQGKPDFRADCFIYKKSRSVWKLRWKKAKWTNIDIGIHFRAPIPGLQLRESRYKTYVAPGQPPSIPSRNDFRLPDGTIDEPAFGAAENEYYGRLIDYNRELKQNSQTIRQVVGEVEFASDDPENGFGDLEPGEYKFIVMTRGRREHTTEDDNETFKGPEDLYAPEVIKSSKLAGMPPSALKRYGWDYKEAVVIITGGKETETVGVARLAFGV